MSSEVYAITRSIYETFYFTGLTDNNASIKVEGRRLNALGGKAAMLAAYQALNAAHCGFVCLNIPWNGIGGWLA
jgi:hypothetical protein